MAQPSKDGRGRIDYKGDKEFVDAVHEAARVVTGGAINAYVTMALRNQMKADGIDVPMPEIRPVGRPPKPAARRKKK